MPAALAAGVLGLGMLAGSPAAATGTEPDEPEHNVEELTESIQNFAEEQLDAHADAVSAALEALESAKGQLDAAVVQEAAAREAEEAASTAAEQASRALDATLLAEQEASRTLAALTARVDQTRERLGLAARTAYQSGFGGWSALRAGDDAMQEYVTQLADLESAQVRLRSLREDHRYLVLQVAKTSQRLGVAEEDLRAATQALEDAQATHAEADSAAGVAREEEYAQYQEFLAESKALEAWLAEYSINDTLEGTGSFVRPGTGPVTSSFGPRMHPILGYVKTHTGIDIGRGDGFIYAADHGIVADARWNDGYGYMVIVDHGLIDGQQVSTLYAHQPGLSVDVGDKVAKGQPIGSVGSTGLSTGPHLHFEVRIGGRPVNPWPWISSAPMPDEAG
ncbi:MAG TPA: peptidoglycan DD-metalloendopeptidase family protein [Jiangellaceae bacterium]|nr:peptidoglycan DD-metalloendopeptidase family protein [Jiangellaceae bacterium]